MGLGSSRGSIVDVGIVISSANGILARDRAEKSISFAVTASTCFQSLSRNLLITLETLNKPAGHFLLVDLQVEKSQISNLQSKIAGCC
jgi:hypothetical protein